MICTVMKQVVNGKGPRIGTKTGSLQSQMIDDVNPFFIQSRPIQTQVMVWHQECHGSSVSYFVPDSQQLLGCGSSQSSLKD